MSYFLNRLTMNSKGLGFSAGSGRRGCTLEVVQMLLARENLAEIDQPLLAEALDAVAHAVELADAALFYGSKAPADDAGEGRVNRGGRPAGLPHHGVAVQYLHFSKSRFLFY